MCPSTMPSPWPCGTPARVKFPPGGHLPLHPLGPGPVRQAALRRGSPTRLPHLPRARPRWPGRRRLIVHPGPHQLDTGPAHRKTRARQLFLTVIDSIPARRVHRLLVSRRRERLLRRSSGGSPRRLMLQLTSQADVSVVGRLSPSPLPRSGTRRARAMVLERPTTSMRTTDAYDGWPTSAARPLSAA